MSEMLSALKDSVDAVVEDLPLGAPFSESWSQVIELGWLLAGVDARFDGLGEGLRGDALIASSLSRKLVDLPVVGQLLALDYESQFSDAQEAVAALAGGDVLVGLPMADGQLAIVEVDGGYRVSGRLSGVVGAEHASCFWGWNDQCTQLIALSAADAGVVLEPTPLWDRTLSLSDVHCHDVFVETSRLRRGADVELALARLLNRRDVLLAAQLLGAARTLFDRTVEHLKVRQQFSRPLAMFQALKHRCADLQAKLVSAEALLSGQLGHSPDTLAALQMKYHAGEVASWVAEEALQLHGGIGMASEHDCHLFLKRILLLQQLGRQQAPYPALIAAHV
jgi:alkylation response protein AidB-like acyl-CoA dehydrogenase